MSFTPLQRILLAEDERDIQMVAAMALEELGGFEVAVCSSGREALERYPDFEPDLVLLDVMMPELDGPGTFAALRQQAGGDLAPVVFMTARAQLNELEEYRKSGAIDVIIKPFDPMGLADRVREIWRRHHRA